MNTGFLDEVKIYVKGGDGGSGCLAFHREKYIAKGGPSGGSGGRGGSVFLVADENINSLNDFSHGVHFKADRGQHGMGSNCTGENADDKTIHVPVGTIVGDPDSGDIIADLAYHGQVFLAARGGIGGRGNAAFASATYKLPRFAEKGEPGEERWLKLVLKVIAQVGIIGFPNAGKSTLLSRISAARPRIADYPFTTLVPNLGMVWLDEHRRAVFADIPGLIEGAHEGVGLGHKFLRHVERTRLLVHVIDSSSLRVEDPLAPYRAIRSELAHYGRGLEDRPEVVALNKIDLPIDNWSELLAAYRAEGLDPVAISAKQSEGLEALLEHVNARFEDLVSGEAVVRFEATDVLLEEDDEEEEVEVFDLDEGAGLEDFVGRPGRRRGTQARFTVRRDGEGFVVEGRALERMVSMANLENDEAVQWLQARLFRMGVDDALKHAGAASGTPVRIATLEFEFQDEEPLGGRPTRKQKRTIAETAKAPGRRPKTTAGGAAPISAYRDQAKRKKR